jgi:hypothetical protein
MLLALAVALVLRVQQLARQILVGDEWHALEKAATSSFAEIATSLGSADHSVPIALYYRALASTIGLTETGIRLPFLLAGLATVAGGAWIARRVLERATADAFTWLLAISPVLVFYSRFARPYAFTWLLGSAALLASWSWWRHGRRSAGVLYVACVAAAGWLHAASLPFVAAPFVCYGVQALRLPRSERRRALVRLAVLGAASLATLVVLLLPPVLLDPDSVARKTGWGLPLPATVVRAAGVLSGSRFAVLTALLGCAALVGCVRLARARRELVVLFASAGALQLLAILVTTPAHRTDSFALARYMGLLVPAALLAVAAGVVGLFRGARARALAGPLLGATLLVLGPLPATWRRPSDWSANELVLGMLGKRAAFEARVPVIPAFHTGLAQREPGSVTLVEAPWFWPLFGNPLPVYQSVHRQHTRIGFMHDRSAASGAHGQLPCPAPGFDLGSFVCLESLLSGGEPSADYLVLHRDFRREIGLAPGSVLRVLADEAYVDVEPIVARFRARFGAPVFEDELVVVFALR